MRFDDAKAVFDSLTPEGFEAWHDMRDYGRKIDFGWGTLPIFPIWTAKVLTRKDGDPFEIKADPDEFRAFWEKAAEMVATGELRAR